MKHKFVLCGGYCSIVLARSESPICPVLTQLAYLHFKGTSQGLLFVTLRWPRVLISSLRSYTPRKTHPGRTPKARFPLTHFGRHWRTFRVHQVFGAAGFLPCGNSPGGVSLISRHAMDRIIYPVFARHLL